MHSNRKLFLTLNPKSQALNPKCRTLNPEPQTPTLIPQPYRHRNADQPLSVSRWGLSGFIGFSLCRVGVLGLGFWVQVFRVWVLGLGFRVEQT